MVEIARAVRPNARIIIFDEPTAALTPEEKRHFFALVRRLKQRGVSVDLHQPCAGRGTVLSDRITMLRDGERIVTGPTGNSIARRWSAPWSDARSPTNFTGAGAARSAHVRPARRC